MQCFGPGIKSKEIQSDHIISSNLGDLLRSIHPLAQHKSNEVRFDDFSSRKIGRVESELTFYLSTHK